MGIAIGAGSYAAFGQQTVFGTVQTSLITSAFIRSGSLFSARDANQPRATTTSIMPKASQLWQKLALTDVDLTLEAVTNDTAFLPLFTAVWGRRLKVASDGAAAFRHHYTLWNPPVDGGTDGTPSGCFYNHSLTMREIPGDGVNALSPRVVQDVCIDRFVLSMEADSQLRFQVTGTGQKQASSSAPGFTDITGTTLSYLHANNTANSGLFLGSANPPTSAFLAKSVIFTLENNMRYEPFLGATAGNDMKIPTTAGFPSASCSVTMDFEDTTGADAVQIMSDFLSNTKHKLRVEYYVDANNGLELISTGSMAVNCIDDAKPVYAGEGSVGFTFTLKMYPNSIGLTPATGDEFKMVQATAT